MNLFVHTPTGDHYCERHVPPHIYAECERLESIGLLDVMRCECCHRVFYHPFRMHPSISPMLQRRIEENPKSIPSRSVVLKRAADVHRAGYTKPIVDAYRSAGGYIIVCRIGRRGGVRVIKTLR